MAIVYEGPFPSAPAGSTGNNTHSSLHVGSDYSSIVMQFVVEAIGATPTVTFKWQGSPDNTNWYDIAYTTDASDTLATAARTVTAAGASIQFTASPSMRRYKYYRLVTSANTNITYRGEIYTAD
jgi:hypothetical protein